MAWGVVLLVFGVVFALAPLRVARVTGYFRFVPYPSSPSSQQLRYFRASGAVIAAAGLVLILVA